MARQSFANLLLTVKEKISYNPSSVQIADTLDYLIFKAIKPVIYNTHYVEKTLVEIISFVAVNGRRKLSKISQQELTDMLFTIIVSNNNDEKYNLLKKIRLERSVYFMLLDSLHRLGDIYIKSFIVTKTSTDKNTVYIAYRTIDQIKRLVGVKNEKALLKTFTVSNFWKDQAYNFRGMIIEKYIKLAYNESLKLIASTKLHIDQNDLFTDLVSSIPKAIDKFDPEKGTLTSYIKWWFLDAGVSGNKTHEYGNVFVMTPQTRKKHLNKSLVINNLPSNTVLDTVLEDNAKYGNSYTIDDKIIDRDYYVKLLRIMAKNNKYAFLTLGLEYELNEEEKHRLLSTLRKTGKIRVGGEK
jgi:hypothetical protein